MELARRGAEREKKRRTKRRKKRISKTGVVMVMMTMVMIMIIFRKAKSSAISKFPFLEAEGERSSFLLPLLLFLQEGYEMIMMMIVMAYL